MLEYVPIPLLKLLYPIREPDRNRDRDLKILCLGLGRTGTESLCAALVDLGYSEVYHGYSTVAPEHIGGSATWYRLGLAKFKYHDASLLTAASFDKVLGNCEAVADLPCAAFGVELLRAYPHAKVVLNRRPRRRGLVRQSSEHHRYALSRLALLEPPVVRERDVLACALGRLGAEGACRLGL